MSQTKETLIYLAEILEELEQYEEMYIYMRNVILNFGFAQTKERNLYSVASKNIINQKRSSWRIIESIEVKQNELQFEGLIKSYKLTINKEIIGFCDDVIEVITVFILPKLEDNDFENIVFFHKMKGDYLKYICETQSENSENKYKELAKLSYEKAFKVAEENLPFYNPVRLGLILNYSVFLYEIYEEKHKSIQLIRDAYEETIKLIDDFEDEKYRDTLMILKFLRDSYPLLNCQCQECFPQQE